MFLNPPFLGKAPIFQQSLRCSEGSHHMKYYVVTVRRDECPKEQFSCLFD